MSKKRNTILFIHAPKKHSGPDGAVIREIMAIPCGLFALAKLCKEAGWETEITHIGIEEIIRPDFNITGLIDSVAPDIVAIGLHWHQQLAEAAKLARKIKEYRPEAMVLTGGMTATYFSRQIMNSFSFIDFVISGDAEYPLAQLLKRIEASPDSDLSSVPNLSWRKNGQPVFNGFSYVCGKKDIDALNYSDISLLRNSKYYTGALEHPNIGGFKSPLFGVPPIAHIVTGRGCARNCAFCSGSSENQKTTFNRKKIIMRSPEKVSEDIRHWMANGFQAIYFPFSPPGTEEYYIQLFDLLESKKIVPDSVYLEYFDGLPSRAFLSRFSEVSQDATLVLSPASAVEDVRIAHKLPDYTNRKMENYFYLAEKRNVKIEMYFSMLPNDTVKTLERTMNWIIRLRKYYNAGCKIALIEIEPGSDWFENPGKYNLKLLRTSLKDFVKHHGSGAPAGLSEKLGYAIADEEEKMEIIRQISYICLL